MEGKNKTILKNNATPPPPTLGKRSRVNGDTQLEVTVYFKPHSIDILPDHNDLHKAEHKRVPILSRRYFNYHLRPHSEALDLIKIFARKNRFKVVRHNLKERWAVVKAKVEDLEKAFEINIKAIRIEDNQYYYYEDDIKIPKEIGDVIESISGLNTLPLCFDKMFPNQIPISISEDEGNAVNPQDFAKLYNFPEDVDGSGQTIAIIAIAGGYRKAVLKKYFKDMGIPMPNISWTGVDGAKNNSDPNSKDNSPQRVKEVYMDIQISASLAPGAKIIVYFIKDQPSEITKALKKAIHNRRNRPSIITMSLGKREKNFTDHEKHSMNQALHEAASMNITVIASSGDSGSKGDPFAADDEINVQLPSSHPLVLAVGGTEIHEQDGVIVDEHAWDQLFMDVIPLQSGGGFSDDWPIPSYQKSIIPDNIDHKNKRGVPDVAANASSFPGILFYANESKYVSIGTSAAAPLWAALIARINQHLNNNNIRNIGFANPLLYHKDVIDTFNPVVEGNNGAHETGEGWDACTGLGTPNGTELMEAIHSLKQFLNVGNK